MFGGASGFGAATAPAQGGNTGFSFGGAATAPSNNAQTSGFNFGASSTTQPTASGNGFAFGGSTQPATGTSAFGSTQPATSSLSSFSFGGSAPQSAVAAPAASNSFSFGGNTTQPATTATTPGAFSFGGNTSTTAPGAATGTSSGFSFGGSSATPAAQTNTGFGTSTTTAPSTSSFSFGQPAATTTSGFGSGFGNTANKPMSFGTSTFGQPAAATTFASGNTTAFGAPAPGVASNLNAAAFAAANSPMESLNGIKMAYTDPFQSRFKHMFYNAVDPAQKHLYTRPPHIGEKLWIQAQRDNPDPTNCVPAPVIGFKELETRIKLQQEHSQKFNGYTTDLVKQLQEMEKASRQTDVKLAHCRQQHIALFHRLVQLMRKLEVYKQLRKPLQVDERKLGAILQHIQSLLDNPTQFKAHMHELMTLQAMQQSLPSNQRAESQQLTEEDMAVVFRLLNKQREGLEHLTKILNQDMRDVEIMKKALEEDE